MSDLVTQDGATTEFEERRRKTKVYAHPDFDSIEALLRRGKSSYWIAAWLTERYPTEDEFGNPTDDERRNRAWQLTEQTITRYRQDFMPETSEGIDVVSSKLDDLIGRKMPMPSNPNSELQMLEAAVRVAESNLAKALEQDDEMGMLQATTLEAHDKFVKTLKETIAIKQSLGMAGYDTVAEKHVIDQTSRNLNVEVQGSVDPKTGRPIATEPDKLAALKQLLEMGPQSAHEIIDAADRAAQAAFDADATDIEEFEDGDTAD